MSCRHGCCDTAVEHYRSLNLTMNEHSPEDKKFDADQQAFKRLLDSGTMPASPVGAAYMERRAQSKVEIETGKLIADDKMRKTLDRVHTEVGNDAD